MRKEAEYFLHIVQDTSGNISSNDCSDLSLEDQDSQYLPTTGTTAQLQPIINLSLSKIVNNLSEHFQGLSDSPQKDFFLKVLLAIHKALIRYNEESYELGHIPPLRVDSIEDGSILIEWIFDDFRIAFSLESNLEESSWYLMSNERLRNVIESDYLKDEDLDLLLDKLIYYVIENT